MNEFVVEWEYKNQNVAEKKKTLKASEAWNFNKEKRRAQKKGLQTEYRIKTRLRSHTQKYE